MKLSTIVGWVLARCVCRCLASGEPLLKVKLEEVFFSEGGNEEAVEITEPTPGRSLFHSRIAAPSSVWRKS